MIYDCHRFHLLLFSLLLDTKDHGKRFSSIFFIWGKKKTTIIVNCNHIFLSCCYWEEGNGNLPSFFSIGVIVKKATAASHYLFFFSFIYLWVFCYEKGFFFSLFEKKVFFSCPLAAKKASSLKLTINNDFVIFFNV